MLKRSLATLALILAAAAWRPEAALAIPLFARQYGVTCEKCHSVIPHLNAFGAAFVAYGYRIPGVKPGPAFPISVKANLVDSSENQGDGPNGAGLPKAIVDEVELFTAGAIGSRGSYLVEQYAVDGGERGLLRDAWVNDRLNPWTARIPLYLQAGQFTLPLPVDPETFRDSYQGYTPGRANRRREPVQLLRSEDRRTAGCRRSAARLERPTLRGPRTRSAKWNLRRPEPTPWRSCRTRWDHSRSACTTTRESVR